MLKQYKTKVFEQLFLPISKNANTKNKIKQKNLNTVLANISKTISLTYDSFLLIISQMYFLICSKRYRSITGAVIVGHVH